MKHKWHDEIVAWAGGAEIEAKFNKWDGWSDWELQKGGFVWFEKEAEYRIKPQPKQPKYLYAYFDLLTGAVVFNTTTQWSNANKNLELIGKIEVQE